jgi:hypothetical protein
MDTTLSNRTRARTFAFAAVVALLGCSAGHYTGDGRLSDKGWAAAHDRYVLDLGEIDLNARSRIVKKLAGLPPGVTFAIGLSVGETAPNSTAPMTPKLSAVVRLTVISGDGTLIIAEEAPLNEWVTSQAVGSSEAFLYRRGRSVDVPLPDGAATHSPVDVRPDGGWGSYFTTASGAEYSLTLEVMSGEAPPVPQTRLVAKGGSWK